MILTWRSLAERRCLLERSDQQFLSRSQFDCYGFMRIVRVDGFRIRQWQQVQFLSQPDWSYPLTGLLSVISMLHDEASCIVA